MYSQTHPVSQSKRELQNSNANPPHVFPHPAGIATRPSRRSLLVSPVKVCATLHPTTFHYCQCNHNRPVFVPDPSTARYWISKFQDNAEQNQTKPKRKKQ